MSAIAIVRCRRLVPEYALQLGDVTSVTDTHTHRQIVYRWKFGLGLVVLIKHVYVLSV